jgi:hypothetical protein
MHEVTVLNGAEGHLQGLYNRFIAMGEEQAFRFDQTIDEAFSFLSWSPELSPRYRGRIRRMVLPEWNVGLFYIVEARRIIVVGAMDLRQDPTQIDRWLEQF